MALDIGLDSNDADAKMRKFEEFKARQRLRDEMRKEKAAARRDSHSPKPQAAMPKYGLKKPNDEKKQNTVIKRPVRRGDGAGF